MRNPNGWGSRRPRNRMRHASRLVSWLALSACCLGACGGKVVFQKGDGEGGGDDGAGGEAQSQDCFAGTCGDLCTKCVGADCFSGQCSEQGECLPPDNPPSCIDG